ncbi:MAG TPA: glycosyl hydrolase [Abditibacteriaceae bacterium]|jgi:hypothetical protein
MKILSILSAAAVWLATVVPLQSTSAAEPVSPNASPEARVVLNYLHEQSGKKVLAAQHGDTREYEYVHEVTGKYAAIWGTDFIFEYRNEQRVNDVIGWWKKGVIPSIMWHWGAPSKGEGYEQSKMKIDIDQCFVPGTPEHTQMWGDLKRIADHLTKLRDAKVPVIWRPMHECSGGWFWYDMGGGERFQRLWHTMFNYFTQERKLNNLIWVLGYDGSPSKAFDPGSKFYDIVGADTYDGKTDSHLNMFQQTRAVSEPGKLVTFHECGTPPDPIKCITDGAGWSWFMNWDQHVFRVDKSYLTNVYNSDFTVTLDELPKWSERLAQLKPATLSSQNPK